MDCGGARQVLGHSAQHVRPESGPHAYDGAKKNEQVLIAALEPVEAFVLLPDARLKLNAPFCWGRASLSYLLELLEQHNGTVAHHITNCDVQAPTHVLHFIWATQAFDIAARP